VMKNDIAFLSPGFPVARPKRVGLTVGANPTRIAAYMEQLRASRERKHSC